MMKSKKLVLLVSILFIAGLVSCGGGKKSVKKKDTGPVNQEMIGEAEGYGTIFDNDKALARDRAIDDAMNKLVKMKLGTSVEGRSLVQDFALVESMVEAKSSGMVRNWTVIKENAAEGAFIVTIRGEVYPQAVGDAIESTIKNYGRPKFMVLVKETFEGERNMPGTTVTELTMMEIMGNSGFEFVDPAITAELIKRDKGKMNKAMDGKIDASVQDLLFESGIECVIYGEAKTSDQSAALRGFGGGNMKSKQAILNFKAVDVYTGRILATKSENAPGVHIDATTASKMAVQNCLRKMLGKVDEETNKFKSGPFMEQITKKFLQAATGRMIMVSVSGLDNTAMTKFRSEVQGRIRGVKKIYPRDQRGTEAKIEIEFAGKTHDFADELKAKSEALGFVIDIKEQKPNKISMTATKK
jgi:hypothetical protein